MIKSFKIGGIAYKVLQVEALSDTNGSNLYGLCSNVESTIKIANTAAERVVSSDVKDITFYHELIHAMIFSAGISLDEELEESLCLKLSPVLKQFMDTKK